MEPKSVYDRIRDMMIEDKWEYIPQNGDHYDYAMAAVCKYIEWLREKYDNPIRK